MKSGVTRGSILGQFLFNILINGITNFALNAKNLVFADYLKIYRSCYVYDWKLLHSDIDM